MIHDDVMRVITLLPAIAAASFLFIAAPAYAQQQTAFGKKFAPYSEQRRKEAFEELRKMRLEQDRASPTKNGMLADELLRDISEDINADPPKPVAPMLEEWLTVYPKIPPGSQRFLAVRALYLANTLKSPQATRPSGRRSVYPVPAKKAASQSTAYEMPPKALVDKMIACVLNAAVANDWFPRTDLTRELQQVANDSNLDQKLRDNAARSLDKKPLPIDSHFDELLTTTEWMLTHDRLTAHKKIQRVNYKPYQLSWQRKFDKENALPGGKLKEQVAGPVKQIKVRVFTPADSRRLKDLLSELKYFYETLPNSSKEIFAARVLAVTSELLRSNLSSQSDDLFWQVFASLDPKWLEHDEILLELMYNHSFYLQTYDLPSAEKILLKEIEMQDLFYGGIPSNLNLRYVLGDVYDEMHRFKESKEQYEIAREIEERLIRTSIVRANSLMERDYQIRCGTYIPIPSPQTHLDEDSTLD